MTHETPAEATELRRLAVAQLRKRRDFLQHATAYVAVNVALTVIWLLTTPADFFWPMFPLLGWGIGVAFHALDAYGPALPTEDEIEREMNRLAHR